MAQLKDLRKTSKPWDLECDPVVSHLHGYIDEKKTLLRTLYSIDKNVLSKSEDNKETKTSSLIEERGVTDLLEALKAAMKDLDGETSRWHIRLHAECMQFFSNFYTPLGSRVWYHGPRETIHWMNPIQLPRHIVFDILMKLFEAQLLRSKEDSPIADLCIEVSARLFGDL